MANDDEFVNWLYDLTGGRCFYCRKRLSFHNYGEKKERRGAWEVDHFIPLSRNGAHQPRNFVPACVECNREKSDLMPWEFNPDRFPVGDRAPY